MQKLIQSFFAPVRMSTVAADLLLAFPRIVGGYLLCANFGWSKCPAPEWFVSDVAALGFPLPLFFAWAAVLSEVIGGAMLVLGLGTRFAAAMLTCTMLVAIFMQQWSHGLWEMLSAMGFLWISIYALVLGSGRFGLDYFIANYFTKKYKINETTSLTIGTESGSENNTENKKQTILKTAEVALFCGFIWLCAMPNAAFAQSRPLRGSGKIITKNFDFTAFTAVELADLDGKTTIEIGKTFAISIEIDDNLEPFLDVKNSDGKLYVGIYKNKNNMRYLEDTGIKIHIMMPEITLLNHHGNSEVTVKGIKGRAFMLENDGNGSTTLTGSTDKLDIKQRGNGSVQAKGLVTKFAEVKSSGNGDVKVNASVSLTANGRGNGSIINVGKGKMEALSGVIGNGEVRSE
jgi:uncharacterized membrane protein YphA (DoxX/SURF4 family)